MSRAPWTKVSAGDPVQFSATEHNSFIDAALAEIRRSRGGGRSTGIRTWHSGAVLAKISTASTVPQFGVVALTTVDRDPERDISLEGRVFPVGATPATGNLDKVAITLEPGAAGDWRLVLASGVAPALVEILDESHGYATGKDGSVTMLQSAPAGPIQILTKQAIGDRDTSDEAWCVVRLGAEQGGGRWFTVVSSTPDASPPTQFAYTLRPIEKTAAGYGGWSVVSGSSTVTGYHTLEDINDGSGVEGTGIDVDGGSFPSDFELQPIPAGTPVWAIPVVEQATNTTEWWITAVSSYDGDCDPAALDVSVGFAATMSADQTTTSGTFAAVDKWTTPTFISSDVMSFDTGTGTLTVDPGTYRLSIQAGALATTNDATLSVRMRESTDGGGATTVGPTLKLAASALASDPVLGTAVGYLTVAGGSTSEITVEVARAAGTGTAVLDDASTVWEAERVA